MDIRELLFLMNKHWEEDFFYSFPMERKLFPKVYSHLKYPIVIAITGIRRTGKTTLLFQLIDKLVEEGVPRKNILYFSFDEEKHDPIDVVKEWERIIGRKVRGGNFYLFLDEVQNVEMWGRKVKLLCDSLNIKIVVTGSSSLKIRKGRESLAGRMLEFSLPPLSWDEYKKFSQAEECNEKRYFEYIARQLPFLALHKGFDVREYVRSIARKVIFEDSQLLYSIEEPEILEEVFKVISSDPGQIVKVDDIAKDLGIARGTARKYLSILENSFLIRKLYNYSRNARKREVRSKKFYPYFSTLCYYHVPPEDGKLVETEVAFQLDAEFFLRERNTEVDFVSIDGSIGVEVKFRRRIDSSDVSSFRRFPFIKKRFVVVREDSKVNCDIAEPVTLCEMEKIRKGFTRE